MKKILFPTDFSSSANHALRHAIGICESLKADLVLFHSCRVDALVMQGTNDDVSEEAIVQDAKEKLRLYRETHLANIHDIQVEERVEYGFAVDTILKVADEIKADMIVMGTKGASGLEEVLLGSNTANVMDHAQCPVLAIPDKSNFQKIEQIAFATDFRENDVEAIIFLSGIAANFKSELMVVHVADFLVPANYEKALLEVFEEDIRKKVFYKYLSFRIIQGMNPTRALNEFVKDNFIDMIAVSTRKKNILTRMFDSSFTKKLAYHSTIPVMAFHPHK